MPDSNWVPTYAVRINGKELPQSDDLRLQNITVDLRRQAPASAEIQFNNNDGKYDTRADLAPGAIIEVEMGYTKKGNTKIFEGEIIGTQVRLAENGPRSFVVRAFDYMHRLSRGRKTRTFLDQKFSDVITTVASDWGLQAEVDDTAFVREYIIEHNQTDMDFARGFAGWMDFDLHIRHLEDPKKLRFKAPEVGGEVVVKAVYEKPDLAAGDTFLRKFNGRQSLARVVSEVTVRGWDIKTKREIIGTAANDLLYDVMGGDRSAVQEISAKWGETDRQLVDYKVFSQDEADKIAETKLNEYARTFLRAEMEIQGQPMVHPGSILEVSLVGPRYDGPYFVEKVSHCFTSAVKAGGGYTTRLSAARCGW